MKVFISWSGDLSKEIAHILKEWLSQVIQAVDPFMSITDIAKGSRWFSTISKELDDTDFGICCVTHSNSNSSWLMFEAGALSKKVNKSNVVPLVVDLKVTDLKGPLSEFNGTEINKKDMLTLIKTINNLLGDSKLTEKSLEKSFNMWWPDFDKNYHEALSQSREISTPSEERPDRELIEEILKLSRRNGSAIQNLEKYIEFIDEGLRNDRLVRMVPRRGLGVGVAGSGVSTGASIDVIPARQASRYPADMTPAEFKDFFNPEDVGDD